MVGHLSGGVQQDEREEYETRLITEACGSSSWSVPIERQHRHSVIVIVVDTDKEASTAREEEKVKCQGFQSREYCAFACGKDEILGSSTQQQGGGGSSSRHCRRPFALIVYSKKRDGNAMHAVLLLGCGASLVRSL